MANVILVDPTKCTGCRMCQMACSLQHEGACGTSLARIQVVRREREGIDIPVLCQHCADAPCMTICPTGALHRESAVAPVLLEEQLCIGCRMCIMACPFGAIGLYLHGEKGAIVKCDLCQGDPQCVRFCEPSALKFVRRDQVGSAKRDAVVDAYLASVKTVEAGG